MPEEIYWLTLLCIFTSIMWMPYIIQMVVEVGISKKAIIALGNGTIPPEKPWAARLKKAHANTIENLVIFVPLVLSIVILGKSNELTATLAMVFTLSRIIYTIIFTLGIPVVRTIVFMAGLIAQLGLALIILGVL